MISTGLTWNRTVRKQRNLQRLGKRFRSTTKRVPGGVSNLWSRVCRGEPDLPIKHRERRQLDWAAIESTGEESESTGEESWRGKSFRKVCEEVITNGKRPPVSEARLVMTVAEIELVGLASFGGVRSR